MFFISVWLAQWHFVRCIYSVYLFLIVDILLGKVSKYFIWVQEVKQKFFNSNTALLSEQCILTVVVCLGANSGPLTVVLLSGFVLHGERAWGISWVSLMLPIAIWCHCCPTLCQFLMKFVDVLQSSYCLVSVVGQHSFVQLWIMAYLLVLTRLLVIILCFYVTIFISQQLISNLARLPI